MSADEINERLKNWPQIIANRPMVALQKSMQLMSERMAGMSYRLGSLEKRFTQLQLVVTSGLCNVMSSSLKLHQPGTANAASQVATEITRDSAGLLALDKEAKASEAANAKFSGPDGMATPEAKQVFEAIQTAVDKKLINWETLANRLGVKLWAVYQSRTWTKHDAAQKGCEIEVLSAMEHFLNEWDIPIRHHEAIAACTVPFDKLHTQYTLRNKTCQTAADPFATSVQEITHLINDLRTLKDSAEDVEDVLTGRASSAGSAHLSEYVKLALHGYSNCPHTQQALDNGTNQTSEDGKRAKAGN
jgi:hypothetical protein